ncbi:hypothetical protein BCR43DRAFT_510007 [Syncephalastrum racemosum]|uniref:Rho-GAP domain-containing protein n=1 Tax=Syncephalastrum racemosum TaxID=13706 RepID=A0A1X2HTQ1_SYNRA|nr:hypothetical protein BCR43DRAFT_510007 [Syncephalastrum racemosum]
MHRNKRTKRTTGSKGKRASTTAFHGAEKNFQISLTHVLNKYPYTTQSGLHIPVLVAQCLREILARGLTAEGIFRRSGSTATIHQLMSQWCGSPGSLNLTDTPIHTVAGLLKLFLQHLEVPLIPTFCHDDFLRACDEAIQSDKRDESVDKAIQILPEGHRDILRALLQTARLVSDRSAVNYMTPGNLALVFAPTCIRLSASEEAVAAAAASMSPHRQGALISIHALRSFLTRQLRCSGNEPLVTAQIVEEDRLEALRKSARWTALFEGLISTTKADLLTLDDFTLDGLVPTDHHGRLSGELGGDRLSSPSAAYPPLNIRIPLDFNLAQETASPQTVRWIPSPRPNPRGKSGSSFHDWFSKAVEFRPCHAFLVAFPDRRASTDFPKPAFRYGEMLQQWRNREASQTSVTSANSETTPVRPSSDMFRPKSAATSEVFDRWRQREVDAGQKRASACPSHQRSTSQLTANQEGEEEGEDRKCQEDEEQKLLRPVISLVMHEQNEDEEEQEPPKAAPNSVTAGKRPWIDIGIDSKDRKELASTWREDGMDQQMAAATALATHDLPSAPHTPAR